MTEQTPLERLEQSIANFEIADFNCEYRRSKMMKEDAIAYIKHAEARIKELEVEMEKLIQLAALQAEQISRMPSQEKLNDN